MRALALLAALTSALAGCGNLPSIGVAQVGRADTALPYRARLSADRGSRDFAVSVAQGGAGLDAVRESVRFPATRRCIARFGSSEIDWVSQGDPENWIAVGGPDGRAIYRGRCTGR